MIKNHSKETYWKRKARIRRKIHGTADKPRLTVYRSTRHIYAQVIDDEAGLTLAAANSNEKELRGGLKEMTKSDVAQRIGQTVAERCLAKDIKRVVFDRNGFIYHGRVAKLAEAAREKGLSF